MFQLRSQKLESCEKKANPSGRLQLQAYRAVVVSQHLARDLLAGLGALGACKELEDLVLAMTDDTPLLRVVAQASAVALLSIALYRLFLAPLARIPGPALSALTRLPLILREFTGRRSAWIHDLHVKYGPVVRVAPDEVSFATREAAKEIYTSGGSGYDKTSFYKLFEHFDTPSVSYRVPH